MTDFPAENPSNSTPTATEARGTRETDAAGAANAAPYQANLQLIQRRLADERRMAKIRRGRK